MIGKTLDADWQYEVANENTRLGYTDWVMAQHESEGIEYCLERPIDCGPTQLTFRQEHDLPLEKWMAEVAQLNTRRSYVQWVLSEQKIQEML